MVVPRLTVAIIVGGGSRYAHVHCHRRVLLIGALGVALGIWQLQRADVNRATSALFAAGATEAALPEPPAVLGESERFRRLEVRGEYVAAPQFLQDNMLHAGVAGYHVLTPVRLEGGSRWLLVNRGWIGTGADRGVLPDVSVDAGVRTLSGRLERLPRPGVRLGQAVTPGAVAASVAVVQYPTVADLEVALGKPLFDYQLLLDPAAADGYVREWRAPGVGPERNLSYAGQWLLLAAGAIGAALFMLVKAMRRRP